MLRSRLFDCFVVVLFFANCGSADALSSRSETENRVGPPDVTNHKNLNLLPEKCGHYETESKIVNGQDAGLTEYPWMALLLYNTKRERMLPKCGGSIINKNYILTAAHCVKGLPDGMELIKVRVGEHTISKERDCEVQEDNTTKCNPPVQDLDVEKIIPHTDYRGLKTGSDIALVRVSTINLEAQNAKPVCLPTGSARDKRFSRSWIAGWGATLTERRSDVLQEASIPVPNEGSCAKYHYRENELNFTMLNTQICADIVNGVDSCKGDSGGPLMVATLLDGPRIALVQQGVLSGGPAECGTRPPAIYTRVTYFMDWILDNMKE